VQLPPEDQPDTIDIGPIKGVPIFHEDDPRLTEERAARAAATRKAQALHSADELISGMADPDWRVRLETVDRLIARARHDERTLPTLLRAATADDAWQVRDAVVIRLNEFDVDPVLPVLRDATNDAVADVRWSARYALFQMGLGPDPGPTDGSE
jgi:HEAT repeat protein